MAFVKAFLSFRQPKNNNAQKRNRRRTKTAGAKRKSAIRRPDWPILRRESAGTIFNIQRRVGLNFQ